MYHGLAGSSSGALFPAPTQFLTAGIIASYEQGAGGGGEHRNEAPEQIKNVHLNYLRNPNLLRACFTICNAKG